MKKILALSLLALTAGCMADRPMEMSQRGGPDAAESLAVALQGRVPAGPPQNCVSTRNLGGNRSAGEGAIIFQANAGNLVYVNRPPAGCPDLRGTRALRTRTTSTQLCRGDIAEVFDPVNGFSYGACSLGDFEPFRRVR